MKRVKKIKQSKIKRIVKEQLLSDDLLIPETKVDGIIKEYLSERDEFLDDETALDDKVSFTEKTIDALRDMLMGLTEMIGDLEIIKEKEGNVLVTDDMYSDEVMTKVIDNLTIIVDDLDELEGISKEDLEEE